MSEPFGRHRDTEVDLTVVPSIIQQVCVRVRVRVRVCVCVCVFQAGFGKHDHRPPPATESRQVEFVTWCLCGVEIGRRVCVCVCVCV